jgi:hypothetical protein
MHEDRTSARLQYNCAIGTCSQAAESRSPAEKARSRAIGTHIRSPQIDGHDGPVAHSDTYLGQGLAQSGGRQIVEMLPTHLHAKVTQIWTAAGPMTIVIVAIKRQKRLLL